MSKTRSTHDSSRPVVPGGLTPSHSFSPNLRTTAGHCGRMLKSVWIILRTALPEIAPASSSGMYDAQPNFRLPLMALCRLITGATSAASDNRNQLSR